MAEEDVACIGPTSNNQNEVQAAINVPSASSDPVGEAQFFATGYFRLIIAV